MLLFDSLRTELRVVNRIDRKIGQNLGKYQGNLLLCYYFKQSCLAVFFRNSDLTGMDNFYFHFSVLSLPSFGNHGLFYFADVFRNLLGWVGI